MTVFSTYIFAIIIGLTSASYYALSTYEDYRVMINKTGFVALHYDLTLRLVLHEDPKWDVNHSYGNVTIHGFIENGLDDNRTEVNTIYLQQSNLQIDLDSVTFKYKNGSRIQIENIILGDTVSPDRIAISTVESLRVGEDVVISMNYKKNYTNSNKYSLDMLQLGRGSKYSPFGLYEKASVFTQNPYVGYLAIGMFPCAYDNRDEPSLVTFKLKVIRQHNYSSITTTKLVSSTPEPDNPSWIKDKFKTTPLITVGMVGLVLADLTTVATMDDITNGIILNIYAPKEKYGEEEILWKETNQTIFQIMKTLHFLRDYFNESDSTIKSISIILAPTDEVQITRGMIVLPEFLFRMWFPIQNDQSCGEDEKLFTTGYLKEMKSDLIFYPLVVERFLPHKININFISHLYQKFIGDEAKLGIEVWCAFKLSIGGYSGGSPCFGKTASKLWLGLASDRHGRYERPGNFRFFEDGNIVGGNALKRAILKYDKMLKEENEYAVSDINLVLFSDALRTTLNDVNGDEEALTKEIVDTISRDFSDYKLLLLVSVVDDSLLEFSIHWTSPFPIENISFPIIIKGDNINFMFWLKTNETKFIRVDHSQANWILANPDMSVSHRTLYDSSLLTKIQGQLELDHEVFSKFARARLIDDYFHFAWLGEVGFDAPFNLTNYLGRETDFMVWSVAIINYLNFQRHSPETLQSEKLYFQGKFNAILDPLNIEKIHDYSESERRLVSIVMYFACIMENSVCLEKAHELFLNRDQALLPLAVGAASAQHAVRATESNFLKVMAIGGGPEAFHYFLEFLKTPGKIKDGNCTKELNANEKEEWEVTILDALSETKNGSLLKELLNMTLAHNFNVDISQVYRFVGKGPIGRKLLTEFVLKNLQEIVNIWESGGYERWGLFGFPTGENYDELYKFEQAVKALPNFHSFVGEESFNRTMKWKREQVGKTLTWHNSKGEELNSWFLRNIG